MVMSDHIHLIVKQQGSEEAELPRVLILSITGDHAGSPLLHRIIDWFKTMTTNEYIQGVKNGIYEPFDKHIWQRNYYEHIIRNEQDYQGIWAYIETNAMKSEKIF